MNSNSKDVTYTYAKSIVLPCDQVFRNLKNAKHFAIDIGGSLTKLAYCSTVCKKATSLSIGENQEANDYSDNKQSDQPRGHDVHVSEAESDGIRLYFFKFETKYIENCLDFVRDKLCQNSDSVGDAAAAQVIKATGGGALKYRSLLETKLGFRVDIDDQDEMECLIRGCNFLLRNIPDESFSYHHHDAKFKYRFQAVDSSNIFPYLLVNVGSGVSIIKVESEAKIERIGGSSLGGGTFWGLGSLLTQAKGFDDLLELAEKGDHRNVDMLVSDIYGGDYVTAGLPGDLIASSFGKTIRCATDDSDESKKFKQEDIARSLLLTISNCIGQIAFMYAQQCELKRIYFGGFFIRGHPISMRTLTFAINYWSKGDCQALFLRHEGYLGAIGAFVKAAANDDTTSVNSSWNEYYAGSSGFTCSVPPAFLSKSQSNGALIHQLELECAQKNLVPCPLLENPNDYVPDSVDLTQDDEAREYYLATFEKGIEKTVRKAVSSQASSADASDRALAFNHAYVQHLRLLRQHPFAYGCLNVRSLLDLNEQLLGDFYFPDVYIYQKQKENDFALSMLPERLAELSRMSSRDRQMALVMGVLAGNVFDWGASEIVKLMESPDNDDDDDFRFTFADAEKRLQPRPWLYDGFDAWQARLASVEVQNCACIFVDNSGPDIILGIFPFVIELLNRGTKVLLCANSSPALNDVTYKELLVLSQRVAHLSPVISKGLAESRLLIAENGQGSPCLDLSRIDGRLAKQILEQNVDLLVIEGMGRAVHTNFFTKFNCDCLKIAVLKNQWLAKRLGGEMFSVVFKYEEAASQQA